MKIGLVDVDGKGNGFPNLALMKISAYHKSQGDEVAWADRNGKKTWQGGQCVERYMRDVISKIMSLARASNVKSIFNYGNTKD